MLERIIALPEYTSGRLPPLLDFDDPTNRTVAAVRALAGLIVLGNEWESVDLFNTLAQALEHDDPRSPVALMARLRCHELIDDGRRSLVPGAPTEARGARARDRPACQPGRRGRASRRSTGSRRLSHPPRRGRSLAERTHRLHDAATRRRPPPQHRPRLLERLPRGGPAGDRDPEDPRTRTCTPRAGTETSSRTPDRLCGRNSPLGAHGLDGPPESPPGSRRNPGSTPNRIETRFGASRTPSTP